MFILLILFLVAIGYYFLKNNYEHWNKRNVPGPKPMLFFGNMFDGFLMRKSFGEIFVEAYAKFHGERVVGMYRATTPTLLIRDPEIIKDIMVKSFQHFYDNDIVLIDKEIDPVLGRNPFFLKGEEWNHTRKIITPCFTSGKIKGMVPLIHAVNEEMVNYIAKHPHLEAKELCTRFTLCNVASCAFGLDGKCFKEEKNNEFRQLANDFLSPGGFTSLKTLLIQFFPALEKIITMKFVAKQVEDKLMNIVEETIKYREANGIVRNDFLHIMNELKKSSNSDEFTMLDVTSHAASFFADGFETSSIVMSFTLYELGANEDVQEKLRDEIETVLKKCDGKLTYEAIQDMNYLDAVICENLRMHPAAFNLQKKCTKTYKYTPPNNERPIEIEEGTSIVLPAHAIQNDSEYFANPAKFDPERFLGDRKKDIVKGTYFPFGDGPRACLGQRFGTLQIKAGIVAIVKNYKIAVDYSKTKVPFKYDPKYFMISPLSGIWLNFGKI